MIHPHASIERLADEDEYVLVPLTRCELGLLVSLWAHSDLRDADDLSIQLKAAGGIAVLDALAERRKGAAAE